MKYIIIVLGMLAFAPSLQAEIIGLSYQERTWNYYAYLQQAQGYTPFAVNLPGMITYRNWGTDDPGLNTPNVYAFAADIDHNLFYGKTSYSIQAVSDVRLEELWGRHYNDLWVGTFKEQQQKVTAFSLAVWEIKSEQTTILNVLTDSARLNTYSYKGQSDLANQWLGELDGSGPRLEIKKLVPLFKYGVWKDLYVTNGATVVPEPSALILFAGLIFCGFMVRKRCS
jgi:hypothetical protein